MSKPSPPTSILQADITSEYGFLGLYVVKFSLNGTTNYDGDVLRRKSGIGVLSPLFSGG